MKLAAVLIVSVLAAVGCGDGGDGGSSSGGLSGELVVFAAASLTDAFGDIARVFERQHPAVTVVLDFGPSSRLAAQIAEGAPADVFASADHTTMAVAVDAGAVRGEPEVFARNRLEIAVPAGNPGQVSGLDDFADEERLIGLCAEEVPCGRLGREALAEAGVAPAVDTNEADVRSLLTKIEAGELDAGLVYRTDVLAAEGAVEGIELPEDVNVASYPVAALVNGDTPYVAANFVELLRSERGRRILAAQGFLLP